MSTRKEQLLNVEQAIDLLIELGWKEVDFQRDVETFNLTAVKGAQQLSIFGVKKRTLQFIRMSNTYGGKDMLRIICDNGTFYTGANSCAFYGDGASITSSFLNHI